MALLSVCTSQYFKLRNHFLRILSVKYTLHTIFFLSLLVTTVGTTPVRDPQQTANLGIKQDNSWDALGGMAKLKRSVLSAVQPHVNSGYCPFWKYTIGMRRKPGFLWAARLGVNRFQTPNITLLVVIIKLG